MINVFTDGACSNNGKQNAKAGIGVFFEENDPRNVSRRVDGKQTNNTAELTAIVVVFDILREDIEQGKNIIIHSDSEYSINCMTKWGVKWAQDNWSKKTIKNLELVKEGYELFQQFPNVSISHVKAHTESMDPLSVGNRGADRLANESIGLQECPYADQKYYLNVSYEQKDVAKSLGSKWDPKRKKWYYMGSLPEEQKTKLMEMFQ